MARLSRNERIRQHKKVYGRTFIVEGGYGSFEIHDIEVKITKLIKKGTRDIMYVVCRGHIEYDHTPFKFFAYVTWTADGPVYIVKGGDRGFSDMHVAQQIIKGCETILLEITILEESNE